MNNKKFLSFQGLRLLFFLVVFIVHIGKYRIFPFNNSGRYAITFFIMISGFLYGYQNNSYQLKETYHFMKEKIKKYYPIYFI